MSGPIPDPQVLVIGIDPRRMGGGFDPEPVVQAIDTGMAKFAEHGIGAESCLFGIDGSDDPEQLATAALASRAWKCVIVGVGLRKADNELLLFEQMINLVHRHAPNAAIAFNATLPEFYEAAARWLDLPSA
jgi:hypothetical protein